MRISFDAGIIVDNKLYLSDNFSNSLLSLDLDIMEMDYIGSFPEETKTELLHKKAFEYKGRIIFVPFQGDNVHIYTPYNNTIDVLHIPHKINERYAIADAAVVDSKIVIFPGNLSQPIITVNMNDLSVKSLGVIEHELLKKQSKSSQSFMSISVKEHYIYSAVLKTHYILKYDVDNRSFELIDTGVNDLVAVSINDYGMWLSTQNGDIYQYDDATKSLSFTPINGNHIYNCHYLVVQIHGNVMALSAKGGEVFCFDFKSKAFEKISDDHVYESEKDAFGYLYGGFVRYRDEILLFPIRNGEPYLLSTSGMINQIHYHMKESEQKKYKNNLLLNNLLKEGDNCLLSDYLNAIVSPKNHG